MQRQNRLLYKGAQSRAGVILHHRAAASRRQSAVEQSGGNFLQVGEEVLMLKLFRFYILVVAVLLTISCQAQTKSNVVVPTNNPAAAKPTPMPAKSNSKIKFSSVYTKLNLKNCREISKPASEEDEVPYICDGYKDYKIFINTHGLAHFFVGREISATDPQSWANLELPTFQFNAGFDQTIEWRLADGEPFACIVRVEYDKQTINPDEKGIVNQLVVQNLRGFAPISETIDARKNKRANGESRRRADAGYGKL